MADNTKVEFENDRVRVTRVRANQRRASASSIRHDRIVIYLQDGHIARTADGRREEIRRRAGDVIWRSKSQHEIEYLEEGDHDVLVVELKP